MISNVKEKSIKEALEDFMLEKKSEKKSEATIKYYRYNNRLFLNFCQNSLKIKNTDEINKKTIQQFLLWLDSNRDYNTTSANTTLRAIRVFIYWMQEHFSIQIPEFKIKMLPDSQNKMKEIYNKDELEKLLKKPKIKKVRFSEYRNWVMINFFLATGVRKKTLINVKNNDINFQREIINLYNFKAKREYQVDLYPKLRKVLKRYIEIRRGDPEDFLFCTEHGGQITASGIRSAIERYNKARGVNKTSIHAFRRTFASIWIENGGDAYTLTRLLDHTSMDVTREYVQQFGKSKRNKRKNPLESMNFGRGNYINM